jgi:hypothetical protein
MVSSLNGPTKIGDPLVAGVNVRRVFDARVNAYIATATTSLTVDYTLALITFSKRIDAFASSIKGLWFYNSPETALSLRNFMNPMGTQSTMVASGATHDPGYGWRITAARGYVRTPTGMTALTRTTAQPSLDWTPTGNTLGGVEDGSGPDTYDYAYPVGSQGTNFRVVKQDNRPTGSTSFMNRATYASQSYTPARTNHITMSGKLGDISAIYAINGRVGLVGNNVNGTLSFTNVAVGVGAVSAQFDTSIGARHPIFYVGTELTIAQVTTLHAAVDEYLLATRPGWQTTVGITGNQTTDNMARTITVSSIYDQTNNSSNITQGGVLRSRRVGSYYDDGEGNSYYESNDGQPNRQVNTSPYPFARERFWEAKVLTNTNRWAVVMYGVDYSGSNYLMVLFSTNNKIEIYSNVNGNSTLLGTFSITSILNKVIRIWVAADVLYVRNVTDNTMLVNGQTLPSAAAYLSNNQSPYVIFYPVIPNGVQVDEYHPWLDDLRLGDGTGV